MYDGNAALRLCVIAADHAAQRGGHVVDQRVFERYARLIAGRRIRVFESVIRIATGRGKIVGRDGIKRFQVKGLAADGFDRHARAGVLRGEIGGIRILFALRIGNRGVIGAFILLMIVGSLCSMLLGPDLNALVGTFI